MSEFKKNETRQLPGYLLLQNNHIVPLYGLSPEEIKKSASSVVWYPGFPKLKRNELLSAIVDQLGFRGDFGDYKNKNWPKFQAFLGEQKCGDRVNLFASKGCRDLFFTPPFLGAMRRKLADRVFFGDKKRVPSRVFLPYGTDWSVFDYRDLGEVPVRAAGAMSCDRQRAERILRNLFEFQDPYFGVDNEYVELRMALMGQFGFVDDKLVDCTDPVFIDKVYWPKGSEKKEIEKSFERLSRASAAFRDLAMTLPKSWVRVLPLPYSENLCLLVSSDGKWDFIWRDLRETKPPSFANYFVRSGMKDEDCPSHWKRSVQRGITLYFRRGFWDEKEAHEAEQYYYAQGGAAVDRAALADTDLRARWLQSQGEGESVIDSSLGDSVSSLFKKVSVSGELVHISPLVNISEFMDFLSDSGYLSRRDCDPRNDLGLANHEDDEDLPVAVSWQDAQAYCAWFERKTGLSVRLPRRAELVSVRPRVSPLGKLVEDGVIESALGGVKLTKEIRDKMDWAVRIEGEQGGIRKAFWREVINWKSYQGLDFIDANDALEWCEEPGFVCGRYWVGNLPTTSWGEYKGMKVCFRMVYVTEDEAGHQQV